MSRNPPQYIVLPDIRTKDYAVVYFDGRKETVVEANIRTLEKALKARDTWDKREAAKHA
jgi:hypothetical protein